MMYYRNIIKDWQLFFEKKEGEENRENIMKNFVLFWENADIKIFRIPGKCKLGGKIFNRINDKEANGTDEMTTDIEKLERIKKNRKDGTVRDLVRATTVTGNMYHFCLDECASSMALLIGDTYNGGRINPEEGYYLRKREKEQFL